MKYSPIKFNKLPVRHMILPGMLGVIIVSISMVLIHEFGRFLSDSAGISEWSGYGYALLIEVIGLSLIEYLYFAPKPEEGEPGAGWEWIFRNLIIVVLVGCFLLPVGGTSFYAIKPELEKVHYSPEDQKKLDGINEMIDTQKVALASVSQRGNYQTDNTAKQSQALKKMNEKKGVILSELKVDETLQTVSNQKVAIMVVLRVVLQSGNWCLALIVAGVISRYRKREFEEPNQTDTSIEPLKLVKSDKQEFAQPNSTVTDQTRVTLGFIKPEEFGQPNQIVARGAVTVKDLDEPGQPNQQLTDKAAFLLGYFESKGYAVPRNMMLASGICPGGQAEYDQCADELIKARLIRINKNGAMGNWVYLVNQNRNLEAC